MTEQHLHRNINLQPEEGLGFYLYAPNGAIQDGITWNDWESMLSAIATIPGKKQVLMDPGVSGGIVTIPVRTGEATSIYDLSDISFLGARPSTFVDVSNVRLDGIEGAENCNFVNPTSTIATFVTDPATTRAYLFKNCGFVQGPVAATASMFDLDGATSIVSVDGIYVATAGGLDLFDVDAAGTLAIGSLGSNNYGGGIGSASIFGGATPATIGYNADDVYFAANQTTPATPTIIANMDVSLGLASSVGAWGGGVPDNYLDAVNRIANFVAGFHGVIPP